jgi:hypothetical protein
MSDGLVIEGEWVAYSDLVDLSVLALQTTSALLECEGACRKNNMMVPFWGEKKHSGSLSARAVQPLVRLIRHKCKSNKTIGLSVVDTICVCAQQLGASAWIQLYHGIVRVSIVDWQNYVGIDDDMQNPQIQVISTPKSGLQRYDNMIKDLQNPPLKRSYMDPYTTDGLAITHRQDSMFLPGMDQSFFVETSNAAVHFDSIGDGFETALSNTYHHGLHPSSKTKVNQAQLQRAWDVSQCASREDWDEWMRRLQIQLLREAPSPALRASASLAHAYQPLSRELFSAAFVCCWKELSEPYRINLVHALEAAFVADISPEILQALLNLAEFMEHDPSGGLPIDIPILADLALKCRAYAKALHYKEREHSIGSSTSCVEALISINRKLDLQGKLNGQPINSNIWSLVTTNMNNVFSL